MSEYKDEVAPNELQGQACPLDQYQASVLIVIFYRFEMILK